MEIQNLQLFLDENFKSLKQNFRIAKKKASPDSIHDLRVSFKRLNALVQLINYNNNSNYLLRQNFGQLKRLIKAAGILRDLQVLEELFQKYSVTFGSISKVISAQLHLKNENARSDFHILAKKYNHLNLSRILINITKNIQNMESELLDIKIQNIRQNHMMKLLKYSNNRSAAYNLHSARKIIKDFVYWQEMQDRENTQNIDIFIKHKEAGRILGHWHDRLVVYNFLMLSKKSGPIKAEILTQIISQVKNEMKDYKEQYFSLYKNIISDQINDAHQPQTKNTA